MLHFSKKLTSEVRAAAKAITCNVTYLILCPEKFLGQSVTNCKMSEI